MDTALNISKMWKVHVNTRLKDILACCIPASRFFFVLLCAEPCCLLETSCLKGMRETRVWVDP